MPSGPTHLPSAPEAPERPPPGNPAPREPRSRSPRDPGPPRPAASADATRVIILSPVLARPGALPRSRLVVDQFGQAQTPDQGGRQDQPGIGHQAVVVKDDANTVGVDAIGVVAWQHLVS